jgi:hypothetical protein
LFLRIGFLTRPELRETNESRDDQLILKTPKIGLIEIEKNIEPKKFPIGNFISNFY